MPVNKMSTEIMPHSFSDIDYYRRVLKLLVIYLSADDTSVLCGRIIMVDGVGRDGVGAFYGYHLKMLFMP